VTFNWFSILVNNELCKVPLDAVEQHAALFLFQILPQGVRFLAIDVKLLEQIKLDFVVADKALNLFGIAGFLVIELITRESKNA
jgi:hypothetical protein